jgi:anti-sigma factor RsiW
MNPVDPKSHSVGAEDLSLLLDGALSAERAREVEAALERDPALRLEWQRLRALSKLLQQDADQVSPANANESQLAALVQARIRRPARWKFAAAAAAVLLCVSVWWVQSSGSPSAAEAPAAEDFAALVPSTKVTSLDATIDEIEWVQASWLPRG